MPNQITRYATFYVMTLAILSAAAGIMHLVFPKSPSYGFTVMSQIFLHAGLVGSLTLTITKGQDKRIAALEDELAKLGSLQVPKP
jgi:hypothetical protein